MGVLKAGGAEGGQWEAHRGPRARQPGAARMSGCVRWPRSSVLQLNSNRKASCDRWGKRSWGRQLLLVPSRARPGRAGPSCRNRNQQEERRGARRHLEGVSRPWLPFQGGAAVPAASGSLSSPSVFPRPPSKMARSNQPLSHLGSISKFLHLLSLF